MADLVDVIDSVFPSDGTTGLVLNETVRVVFTTEMDEELLANSGFVLEGPDTDQIINTDYALATLSDGAEEDILESPGYQGLVPGSFTFTRLDPDAETEIDVLDTAGTGNLYRTKVEFTPSFPLKKNTTYTLYLVGTEIKARTVFDGVADGANTGDGEVEFSGSYTGSAISDTINIRITKAGVAGVAEYDWWRSSTPLDIQGSALSSRSTLNLLDGVSIRFLDGTFQLDDEFSVVVKSQEAHEGINTVTFSTGSGTISAVPDTTATSPLGTPVVADITSFYVTKITPADGSSNLASKDYKEIVIEFSKAIDASTVTQESVKVIAEAVIDHPNLTIDSPNGEVAKQLTVSGNKLTITL